MPGKQTRLLSTKGPGGEEIVFPLTVAAGASGGPTLAIVAGVHGSEYDGIEATKRLHRWIDCDQLTGRVITVPCLNTPAFYGLAMHVNPVDGENPARVFPGDAAGSHTERMVDLLWREVVSGADAVIDVHGGDLEEELVEYSQINLTGNQKVDEAAEGLAVALDMPFFVRREAPSELPQSGGTLCQIAGPNGIPAVLAEAGSHGILDEICVEAHLKGMRNVLYQLGMLAGTASIENPDPTILYGFAGIAAPVDGSWYPSVKKGDKIETGQVVGEMRDFFGEKLADVTSDESGSALGVMTVLARRKGDMLIGLGTRD